MPRAGTERELTADDMNQLLSEAIDGRDRPSIPTTEAQELFDGLRTDLARAGRAGITIAFLREVPELS